MSSLTISIIVAIVGGVFALIGVLIGHRLERKTAIKLLKMQGFTKASAEFKKNLMEGKYFIDYGLNAIPPTIDFDERRLIFDKILKKQTINNWVFRTFLPDNVGIEFDESCERYINAMDGFINFWADNQNEAICRFNKQTNELLKFTDPKYAFK